MSLPGQNGLEDKTFTFIKHSNLNLSLKLKVNHLEGKLDKLNLIQLLTEPSLKHAGPSNSNSPSELFLVISLYDDHNLLSLPIKTEYKSFKSTTNYNFNQFIEFPLKFKDLTLNSHLIIAIYDIQSPTSTLLIGSTSFRLFGKKSTLKRGQHRLFIHKLALPDPIHAAQISSKVGLKDERGRLEKLMKKRDEGDLVRMDWLDQLSFRESERIHSAESATSEHLFLYIELPRFDFPVVFSEQEYPLPTLSSLTPAQPYFSSPSYTSSDSTTTSTSTPFTFSHPGESNLFSIVDPEIARENPVEAKHRRLVRSHRNGPLDRELKPNAKIRDELNEILRYPPTQPLLAPQRDLIWQFRFYLTRDKRALTKFLKSVVWSDVGEVKQAVEVILPMWLRSEIEMDDCLELLGPGEGFRDKRVRGYAVGLLGKADDDELMLYLLQLVQALKFESISTSASTTTTSTSIRTSSRHTSHLQQDYQSQSQPTLESFLIERSAKNPVLGNHFRWYITVEMEDKVGGKLYEGVAKRFDRKIAELQVESEPDRLELLRRQSLFIARISTLAKDLRNSKEPRPKKVERLRSVLHDPKLSLLSFPPFPLPLDARKMIIGIDAEKSSVFKSNLFPLRLHLLCSDGSDYPIIFKNGDDLRQDQLVIQLFTLMDKLLRQENLDLKLMPYRVLATGAIDGMVQFVNSKTLQDISNEYNGSLLGYLKEGNPDPGSVGTYGIKPEVLDTYVRSCAGYCVVTYLLGVGDRHLDNLLLSPDGHFFHVDFGYILGRDPKPFPPSIKVCKEMVDAMGGMNSPHYLKFKNLCYTGFTSLRKNANLIINLVALMVDGNIQDIKLEPDKAVMKVQDKFLLNLSEEEAIKAFEALLNENSYFASVLDRIHSVAQYWRA